MIAVVALIAVSFAVGGVAIFFAAVMVTLPRDTFVRPVPPRAALVAPRRAVTASVIDVEPRTAAPHTHAGFRHSDGIPRRNGL